MREGSRGDDGSTYEMVIRHEAQATYIEEGRLGVLKPLQRLQSTRTPELEIRYPTRRAFPSLGKSGK
jgi:hypothetical protein